MAKMATTAGAENFRAIHAEGSVGMLLDVLLGKGLEEAWPAGARVELGIGGKEREGTSGAEIDPVLVIIEEVAAEGRLGSLGAENAIGGGAELLFPRSISFDDAGRLHDRARLAIGANESDRNGVGIGISHGSGVGNAADKEMQDEDWQEKSHGGRV